MCDGSRSWEEQCKRGADLGVKEYRGASTMLSYLLPSRHISLRDWSIREMQEDAEELAADGVEDDVLRNGIVCRGFFL